MAVATLPSQRTMSTFTNRVRGFPENSEVEGNNEMTNQGKQSVEHQTESNWQEDDESLPFTSDTSIPSQNELMLLCLDHIRDFRRTSTDASVRREGLDPDYLTIACWALGKAFKSTLADNDCWAESPQTFEALMSPLPSVNQMKIELDDGSEFEYDDLHPSNDFRLYPLAGLASGPSIKGPLSLGEVVSAGMVGLAARTRRVAEADMTQSPLFDNFVQAVTQKGFFDGSDDSALYRERHRKVVAKFRTKLAAKADVETKSGDLLALAAAEKYLASRVGPNEVLDHDQEPASDLSNMIQHTQRMAKIGQRDHDVPSVSTYRPSANQRQPSQPQHADIEEAERIKTIGNTHMQRKQYQQAADAYTDALKLSPAGPNSHVYYSNRAAALVSMKDFEEAIRDSERALALAPEYGKAHARLGLAHFLLGNYRPALEAYTVALKYEPDNKSSRNYLEKSAQRLAEQEQTLGANAPKTPTSFSVVSQWNHRSKPSLEEPETSRSTTPAPTTTPPRNHREAEKYKSKGNSLMASREYVQALDAYTKAIEHSPDGPHSHVYFSNRAAALCYLEQYQEAQNDSLQSLVLNPTYGKAHARLGLSRFFLQDYQGAIEAYEASLRYDPGNMASKSYLLKAQNKLEQQRQNIM